jgi:hypothetical protein
MRTDNKTNRQTNKPKTVKSTTKKPAAEKKSAAPVAGTIIPTFESIAAMKENARIALFRQAQGAASSAFLTCGKIYSSMENPGKALRAANFSEGTISNTAYAAKAFKVADGTLRIHLGDKLAVFDETAYDKLTFTQCRLIGQATSDKTLKHVFKPSREQLEAMLKHKGWEEELELFRKDGMTVAERKEYNKLHPATPPPTQRQSMEQPASHESNGKSGAESLPSGRSGTLPQSGGDNGDTEESGGNVVRFPGGESQSSSRTGGGDSARNLAKAIDMTDMMEAVETIEAGMHEVKDPDELNIVLARLQQVTVQLEEKLAAA